MNKINLLMIFSLSFSTNAYDILGGFGGGMDIDHNPAYRRNQEQEREPVKECIIKRDGKSYTLNKKNYSLEELFTLVSTTEKGRELVLKIVPLVDEGKLRIEDLNKYERKKRGLSAKTSALFDFTLDVPTIFIGFKDELGLVAHFFIHEATHAIDELIPQEYDIDMIYYNSFKEMQKLYGLVLEPMKELNEFETRKMNQIWDIKEGIRQKHVYRAERFAFDEQGVFSKQFLEAEDCNTLYIEEHKKLNGLKLYIETPDSHIHNAYNLQKDYLGRD